MKLFYASLLLALIASLIGLKIVASRLPYDALKLAPGGRSAAHTAVSGG